MRKKILNQKGLKICTTDFHLAISGWNTGSQIGSPDEAFKKDYLDSNVWSSSADYIAIARHQGGVVDAFKVFKFKEGGSSLLNRYDLVFTMGHSFIMFSRESEPTDSNSVTNRHCILLTCTKYGTLLYEKPLNEILLSVELIL